MSKYLLEGTRKRLFSVAIACQGGYLWVKYKKSKAKSFGFHNSFIDKQVEV